MIKPYYSTALGKLYHGDCREVLREIGEKFDLIITDPPYRLRIDGVKYLRGEQRYQLGGLEEIGSNKDFSIREYLEVFQSGKMKIFNGYFWCSRLQVPEYMKFAIDMGYTFDILTWHKTNAPPLYKCGYKQDLEFCIFLRGKRAFFTHRNEPHNYNKCFRSATVKNGRGHVCEKPIGVILPSLLNSSKAGDLVGDFFTGSGTVPFLCEMKGRRWVGIELKERYCEITAKRIEEFRKQGSGIYTEQGSLFLQQEAV